jgi:hypothetical protein
MHKTKISGSPGLIAKRSVHGRVGATKELSLEMKTAVEIKKTEVEDQEKK